MKKWYFLVLAIFQTLATASTVDIRELASSLGISEQEDLLTATQREWLRPLGKERWEVDELDEEKRTLVLDWADKHGLFSEKKPQQQSYDIAILLGASTSRIQKRLEYLRKLWEEGIRFQEIVWLTGDRPLDARIDHFTDRCDTESDAAHIVWKEADLPLAMRQLKVRFVSAPMKPEGRPNTKDTIYAWLATSPSACTALFVASQPFCNYCSAILKQTLPEKIVFDVVGAAEVPSGRSPAAITLDTIARWFYAQSS